MVAFGHHIHRPLSSPPINNETWNDTCPTWKAFAVFSVLGSWMKGAVYIEKSIGAMRGRALSQEGLGSCFFHTGINQD